MMQESVVDFLKCGNYFQRLELITDILWKIQMFDRVELSFQGCSF